MHRYGLDRQKAFLYPSRIELEAALLPESRGMGTVEIARSIRNFMEAVEVTGPDGGTLTGRGAVVALRDALADGKHGQLFLDMAKVREIGRAGGASPDGVDLRVATSRSRVRFLEEGRAPRPTFASKGSAPLMFRATKQELEMAVGPHHSPGHDMVGFLRAFSSAIAQPVYKGTTATGEIATGKAALQMLIDGFGKGKFRKVYVSPAKMDAYYESLGGNTGNRAFHADKLLDAAIRTGKRRGSAAG